VAPAAGLPAPVPARVSILPQPAAAVRPVAGWCGPLAALLGWADSVSVLRLQALRWTGTVRGGECWLLVEGEPPPPVPGQFLHRQGSFLLPMGWDLPAAVDAQALAAAWGLAADDRAWFDAEAGTWHQVPAAAWAPLRRSGLRSLA
jgi:hypothetical protein